VRELMAIWMAVVTGLMVIVLAVLFALIQNPGPTFRVPSISPEKDLPGEGAQMPSRFFHDEIDIELGKVLYDTLKCRTCHSVGGEGNRRNPLDGAGSRLETDEIRQWIVSPREIDPDVRKPDYSHLSEDQVDLLVKYVRSLR
jgi:hypothetical protein